MDGLTLTDCLKLMGLYIEHPRPSIGKHLVVLRLIEALEEGGHTLPDDLAKAVVECNDELATNLIEKWRIGDA